MTPAERARRDEAVQKRRLAQYDELVGQCRALFDERNRSYRDSFRTLGVLGILYEFNGIAGRLRSMRHDLVEDRGHAGRGLRAMLTDKLMDAVNYGLMALMLLDDDNIIGEG